MLAADIKWGGWELRPLEIIRTEKLWGKYDNQRSEKEKYVEASRMDVWKLTKIKE